jgi:hypothetical protein
MISYSPSFSEISQKTRYFLVGPEGLDKKTSENRPDGGVVSAQNENWSPVILDMYVLGIDCYWHGCASYLGLRSIGKMEGDVPT